MCKEPWWCEPEGTPAPHWPAVSGGGAVGREEGAAGCALLQDALLSRSCVFENYNHKKLGEKAGATFRSP